MSRDEKSSEVVSSGFQRRRRMIEIGLVFLSVIYAAMRTIAPDIEINPVYCDEEGNRAEGGCRRPDLIAYKFTSFVAMATMGIAGVYHWHISKPVQKMTSKDSTAADRLFGHLEASDFHNACSVIYQLWDLCISLTIPEHADPIFLTHHVLALLTAYFSLEYQLVGYYSIFFGGCSEFSSIFLIFVDKDSMFVARKGSLLDQWLFFCQVGFFLSFLYYRIIGWIGHSFPLWRDCSEAFKTGLVEKHRPGMGYFVRFFQAMNLTLGALQCYWMYEILMAAAPIIAAIAGYS